MCSKPEAPTFPSHRARATDATRSLARMAHARPALSDEVADSRPTPLASLAACDRMVRMRRGPAITRSTALAREAHAEPMPWGLIPRVAGTSQRSPCLLTADWQQRETFEWRRRTPHYLTNLEVLWRRGREGGGGSRAGESLEAQTAALCAAGLKHLFPAAIRAHLKPIVPMAPRSSLCVLIQVVDHP